MRTALILVFLGMFLFAVKSAKAQVFFEGDSVVIKTPSPMLPDVFQIRIQNLDDISESVYHWSYEPTGTFYAPWCNVRVSRSAYWYSGTQIGQMIPENWQEDLKKVNVHFSASALPNRQVKIQVFGGDYELRIKHYAYGNWYSFFDGSMQHYPTGNFQQGEKTFFIPYRIKGAQVATVIIHAGQCSQKIGRVFYLH